VQPQEQLRARDYGGSIFLYGMASRWIELKRKLLPHSLCKVNGDVAKFIEVLHVHEQPANKFKPLGARA
jgi:hypothetical protein